jgi:tRNA(adenine34) deaminase
MPPYKDELFMKSAIEEAKKALRKKEVPIGAVLVKDGKIIARGHNSSITLSDPSGHAEIITLRRGGKSLGNYRLTETDIYVTVEPCIMCMGALLHARVKRLIFGAYDYRAGAAGSLLDISSDERLNHKIEVTPFVLEVECRTLMQGFFRSKR